VRWNLGNLAMGFQWMMHWVTEFWKAQARMGAKINVGSFASQMGKFICSMFYSNIHDFMFKTLKVFFNMIFIMISPP
jgi:hypothetical protein